MNKGGQRCIDRDGEGRVGDGRAKRGELQPMQASRCMRRVATSGVEAGWNRSRSIKEDPSQGVGVEGGATGEKKKCRNVEGCVLA